MLWKGLWLRRTPAAASAGDISIPSSEVPAPEIPDAPAGPAVTQAQTAPATARRRFITVRRVLLAVAIVFVAGMGFAYTQRQAFTAQGADFSRRIIGDERTARLESYYFRLQDRADRIKYRLIGGSTDPFASKAVLFELVPRPEAETIIVDISKPPPTPGQTNLGALFTYAPEPMVPPQVHQLRDTPEDGEGVWTTAGLPRSSPGDPLMLKTFLRPDKSRPYALVGILLMDSRRVRLTMTGGTADPGGDRGVKGPGTIPQDQLANLLAAWNGGFKGPHGGFGMVADGKEYRPLRNGLASIAVMKDGTIRMGEWGSSLAWDENMVAVRQNAVLLVRDGEISKRVTEGNDTWGYVEVNSSEFITWRSAVGLTKDGQLLFAAGNALSAETLAKALWAAGAYTAMQLDINSPYVLLGTFFPQADGSLKPQKFMDNMPDSPSRFFKTQERDFMYVTLDETRYHASAGPH